MIDSAYFYLKKSNETEEKSKSHYHRQTLYLKIYFAQRLHRPMKNFKQPKQTTSQKGKYCFWGVNLKTVFGFVFFFVDFIFLGGE